jgi:hypothetical protein
MHRAGQLPLPVLQGVVSSAVTNISNICTCLSGLGCTSLRWGGFTSISGYGIPSCEYGTPVSFWWSSGNPGGPVRYVTVCLIVGQGCTGEFTASLGTNLLRAGCLAPLLFKGEWTGEIVHLLFRLQQTKVLRMVCLIASSVIGRWMGLPGSSGASVSWATQGRLPSYFPGSWSGDPTAYPGKASWLLPGWVGEWGQSSCCRGSRRVVGDHWLFPGISTS